MNLDRIADIAKAVLYEGYILYPYRPSSLKNQQRWIFGAVFPRDYAAHGGSDPAVMQTQCLVRGTAETVIPTRIRFLHLVQREIGELPEPLTKLPPGREPAFIRVPSLRVGDQTLIPWDEAVEREIAAPEVALGRLADGATRVPFDVPARRDVEPVRCADERVVGVVIRTAASLSGAIELSAGRVAGDAYRLTIRIENTSPLPEAGRTSRDTAQRWAFASTHTILGIENGAFVSLTDPPEPLRAAAAACDNQGTWPVLVGEDGSSDTLLSSPIILPDYPQIAPESPGDLFDGCEIDEILTLRILTMTDEEKREMGAVDPRARALLERTEALTQADLEGLHGALRRPGDGLGGVSGRGRGGGYDAKPRLASIALGGVRLSVGDQVRLRPKRRADIMDVVLDGMLAIIEGIERDFEDRIHLAVTIVDDPGREFGMDRYPGHRFFFSTDEVEPVERVEPGALL